MLRKISILSVPFTIGKRSDVLEEVRGWLSEKETGRFIVTPNPEMIVHAQSDIEFRNVLKDADLSLADGVGVLLAARVINIQGLTRITGVDMVESLCKLASDMSSKDDKKIVTVGFLGGRGSVAERAAECLMKKYPSLHIVFAGEEWGEGGFISTKKNQEGEKQDSRLKTQDSKQIDMLFVAFGFPKQEQWMYKNRKNIDVKVMMGVGGAFDYLSGSVTRAPKAIRDVGLEWLFRLAIQPWRIKRQLSLVIFVYLVFKEKFSSK